MIRRRSTPLTVIALSAAAFAMACAQSEDIDLNGIASQRPANGGSTSPTGLGGSGPGSGGSSGGSNDTGGTGNATGSPGSGGSTGAAGTGTQGQAGNGSAGTSGTAGNIGAGGNVSGQGGSVGGSSGGTGGSGPGIGGSGGSFTGRGGTTGTGGGAGAGFGGRGGAAGRGGAGGATGRGGTTGTGGSTSPDGGTTETFTDVYTTILTAHCGGSGCHNPGSQRGVAFSSQTNAYNSLKTYVMAGNGSGSSLYQVVNQGSMPPGGPKLSASDLAKIKAWIDQGAMNN
ncbi:MAG TPA: hypothetical protein VKQ32_03755 [Polyangia bacterium]|nr:hypothetical protein [Polyangia bacterium]